MAGNSCRSGVDRVSRQFPRVVCVETVAGNRRQPLPSVFGNCADPVPGVSKL
jgi:hypothetical protein